ncbi:multidrug transporter [Luteitalea sp. TBR-22]|uniref:efflux RND transporter permease subunit n=1 Tax=Luteitalea sp. TBR-22 TaxID=2802971 RepID=UPI001AF85E2F|nr:efflux RND transporter permease subunit [Luteitalea sp. TBR-22]BCS35043.1 multidrug transporter [Luteitalea sp. TBR-22]
MTAPEWCIRRPVAATLLTAALAIFGGLAYPQLPVSDLPVVDFPTISVAATLPGASPDTMASTVAMPLERQFATVAGVSSISSTSTRGSTSITLQFDLERDIDAAAQDVEAMIARAARALPPDLPAPPTYQKVNPAASPVLLLTLTSPTRLMTEVDEAAETKVGQQMSMIEGVAEVTVYGAQKYAVRVDADPNALSAHGLSIDDLTTAISSASVNRPTGAIQTPTRNLDIEVDGQLHDAAAFRRVVVAWRNGSPIRLEQVARVTDGVENDQTRTTVDDTRAILLAVQRQPDANTVAVVDRIRDALPRIQQELPADVQMNVMWDRSQAIRDASRDVTVTILLTMALVVLVIFLFLVNTSATLIPALALPTCLLGTFVVMAALGYSLDALSMMALTLSMGFVVDDAVVMLENVVRHMEAGADRLRAALEGAREITFTIVSMTLSLAAVFIPVLFMGGVVGRLLREFSVTIAAAILVSGAVSLTLTPMLCSRFLRPTPAVASRPRWIRRLDAVVESSLRGYARTLRLALAHRGLVLAASILMLVGTVWLFARIPKGFIPDQDVDMLVGQTQAIQGIGFDAMMAEQNAAVRAIRRHPDVVSVTSVVGSSALNTGRLFVRLRPRAQRRLGAGEIAQALRRSLDEVSGLRVFLQSPPAIAVGGNQTKSQYQLTLQGTDTRVLYAASDRLLARLAKLPELQDVTTDLEIADPQLSVKVDRDQLASFGLTLDQFESALYSAYGEREVSTIYGPDDQFQVVLRVAPEFQRDETALSLLNLKTSAGGEVPLAQVARVSRQAGPSAINHTGQLPSVTLSFNLAPGVALGDALQAVSREAGALVPASIARSFQGVAQQFQGSLQGLAVTLVLAVVVIYLVLGVLYESFVHPVTILSGLPSAAAGALVTLWLAGLPLDLFAFVGVVLLVGLVKKNGIMMVDVALAAVRRGAPADAAILEASLVRFRPIMMTTVAALAGALPIALGLGAGAETRQPLGLAVVGGLLVSQALTLYVTPVYFLYLDRIARKVG